MHATANIVLAFCPAKYAATGSQSRARSTFSKGLKHCQLVASPLSLKRERVKCVCIV
jgi:hypothetical protein